MSRQITIHVRTPICQEGQLRWLEPKERVTLPDSLAQHLIEMKLAKESLPATGISNQQVEDAIGGHDVGEVFAKTASPTNSLSQPEKD